jgi:hypothetical protein
MRRTFSPAMALVFAVMALTSSAFASEPKTWDRQEVQKIQYRFWDKARAAFFITRNTVTDGALGNAVKALEALYYTEMGAGQLGMALEDDASIAGPARSMAVWQRLRIDSEEAELYAQYSRFSPVAMDAINAAMAVRDELKAYYPEANE